MLSTSEQADCALKELVALYDDAKLRSMIDGVVGKVLVSPRSVVRPGRANDRDRRQASVRCGVVSGLAPLSPPGRRRRHRQHPRGDLPDKDRQGQCHCRRAAERIPERIRAHRRNTMARNEPTRPYGRILAGDGGLGPRFHLSAPTQGFTAGARVVGKAVSGRCFAFWNAVLSAEAQGTYH